MAPWCATPAAVPQGTPAAVQADSTFTSELSLLAGQKRLLEQDGTATATLSSLFHLSFNLFLLFFPLFRAQPQEADHDGTLVFSKELAALLCYKRDCDRC